MKQEQFPQKSLSQSSMFICSMALGIGITFGELIVALSIDYQRSAFLDLISALLLYAFIPRGLLWGVATGAVVYHIRHQSLENKFALSIAVGTIFSVMFSCGLFLVEPFGAIVLAEGVLLGVLLVLAERVLQPRY